MPADACAAGAFLYMIMGGEKKDKGTQAPTRSLRMAARASARASTSSRGAARPEGDPETPIRVRLGRPSTKTWLGLTLVAGRAGGDTDPLIAEGAHQHLAGVAGKRDGADTGRISGADDLQALYPGRKRLQGIGPEGIHVGAVLLTVLHPDLAGGGQSRDLGSGLGTWAERALLSAAPEKGGEFQAPADILGADPFGGTDLVAAEGEQIHPQLIHSEGDLQKTLYRVGVKEDVGGVSFDDTGALGHWLDGAKLIVHQHHGDQYGILPERGAQVLQGDPAVRPGLSRVTE